MAYKVSTLIGKPVDKEGDNEYVPSLSAFTRTVDHIQKSQIGEREKTSIRRRLREVKDQAEFVKKRMRTTGDVSCDRTQNEEFGNKDMEADDEDMEQIYDNLNSDNQSSDEVELSGDKQVKIGDQQSGYEEVRMVMERFRVVMKRFKLVRSRFRVVAKRFGVMTVTVVMEKLQVVSEAWNKAIPIHNWMVMLVPKQLS